jgi:4-amino-4-deoxy-L-arabinose transferase-like glycosyltransferase
MIPAAPSSPEHLQSTSRHRWELPGIMLLIALSCWVFFYRLGHEDLHDWDEAWHAQVSSEILTSGRWLPLLDRAAPYFNKPPLTFWLRAIAFKLFGINETTSRLFPAVFGFASVLVATQFFRQVCGRMEGLFAGFILCTSWLFTMHHAGRSGETDSTLIFFQVATVAAMWKARQRPAWFYLAGAFTALGWMTKGSTAYLVWPAVLLAQGIERRHRPHREKATLAPSSPWHALGGLTLAFALTLPWQIMMLARYGHAFGRAFYFGEGLLPALQVIENHPGNPMFYVWVFHAFFQPWTVLAAGGVAWLILQKSSSGRPAMYMLLCWAAVIFGACTLFATKMDWYATPALPPIAALAAMAGCELCRRSRGWIILVPVSALGISQIIEQSWKPWGLGVAIVLALCITLVLIKGSPAIPPWRTRLAAILLCLPLLAQLSIIYRVIVRGQVAAEWTALNVDDEPWGSVCRRIDRELPGRPILLVDIPLNPAAYFYLHHLKRPVHVESIAAELIHASIERMPDSLIITRGEYAPMLKSQPLHSLFGDGALIVEAVFP